MTERGMHRRRETLMPNDDLQDRQEQFFADDNHDGRPDGLSYLTEDRNRDGRPDVLEKYLKNLEFRFLVGYVLVALGTIAITLIADWLGRLLGLH